MRTPLACLALLLLAACRPDAPAPARVPAPAPEPSATDNPVQPLPASASANFRCGDVLVGAAFDNARRELVLTVATRRLVLPQAMAASGARYADAQGNEFWNKGDRATLKLDGARLDCELTDQVSAWGEARSRGVAFRGLGTEPFWSLEVDRGERPAIRLALDMGQRPLRVAQAHALTDGEGYAGVASDGSAVVLRIVRAECSDGMSDLLYPARIELQVGGEAFHGCGGFLEP
jgi:putative lipoprotein